MTQIKLPYGREYLELGLAESEVVGVLNSRTHNYQTDSSESELVRQALDNPIASPPLAELARNRDRVTIITSDHTRPVPSRITMPLLLEEIRRGNPGAEITILVATGFHRATTEAELEDKFGREIVNQENFVIHDCQNQEDMVDLGTLPSGGKLLLNRRVVETDLLIAEGFIEPHFFAGFSGGRKSILPGVASKTTVLANHCSEFIDSPQARTGILKGNPLHRDMVYAADRVDLSFILNVVINQEQEVIRAFAGSHREAHRQGADFVSELAGVEAAPAEIVVTTNGGYPLDQNIYQAVKGMTAAEATCKQNGVIIMVSACEQGHGGEQFFKTFAEADKVEEIMESILARDRRETIPDQWESQILARILLNFEVIMVTEAPGEMVEAMHMHYARNLQQALHQARQMVSGDNPRVTVIPDGVSVVVK